MIQEDPEATNGTENDSLEKGRKEQNKETEEGIQSEREMEAAALRQEILSHAAAQNVNNTEKETLKWEEEKERKTFFNIKFKHSRKKMIQNGKDMKVKSK